MDAPNQELLDKQALHEVIMRYCRGKDRLDADLVSSAYHPDAIVDLGAVQLIASEYPARTIAAHEKHGSTMHSVMNESYRVDGDVAYGECYVIAFFIDDPKGSDEVPIAMHAARYIDRFERRNGEWRIAHHQVIVQIAYAPLTGSLPSPMAHRGTRDSSDPSYVLAP